MPRTKLADPRRCRRPLRFWAGDEVETVGGTHAFLLGDEVVKFDWALVKRHSALMAELEDVAHKRRADGTCIVSAELPAYVTPSLLRLWLYATYSMPLVRAVSKDKIKQLRTGIELLAHCKFVRDARGNGDTVAGLADLVRLCDYMKMTDAFMAWMRGVVAAEVGLLWENRYGDQVTLGNVRRLYIDDTQVSVQYSILDEWSEDEALIAFNSTTNGDYSWGRFYDNIMARLTAKAAVLIAFPDWTELRALRNGFALCVAGLCGDVDVRGLYAVFTQDTDMCHQVHRAHRPVWSDAWSKYPSWDAEMHDSGDADWAPPLSYR